MVFEGLPYHCWCLEWNANAFLETGRSINHIQIPQINGLPINDALLHFETVEGNDLIEDLGCR